MRKIWRAACLAAILSLAALPARASPWSEQRTPSPGPARSIGKTDAGCLAGGVALPFDGTGYQVIRISRRRYFGNPRTISFIEALGRKAAAAGLPPFYVGDIAMPRGGPMLSGHVSHEDGLDVDIWFNLDPKADLPPAAREDVPLPSMLTADGKAIDRAQFGRKQVTLLRLAAGDARVDRIFVNPVIKRALCHGIDGATARGRRWLHRIRPWYGHEAHFHVRLRCPANSPGCVGQPPVPPGDGCDATLAWWFRLRAAPPKAKPRPRRVPVLPVACRKLIQR